MYELEIHSLAETEFVSLVNDLATNKTERHRLSELLHEDHVIYDQRGAATTVRMRGWIIHTLATLGLSENELIFVLEELDTGIDPYLVAAAAQALRSYPHRSSSFAPFIIRAITNIRYRNEPVSFESYGEYGNETTPIDELLTTLEWLGEDARGVLEDLERLLAQPAGLSKHLLVRINGVVRLLQTKIDSSEADTCCGKFNDRFSWRFGSRKSCQPIETIIFEDQNRQLISFGEFFKGQPSIVVFFYTRCDNPLKCSLTITKLARIHNLLLERGLADRINTAAITYDPEFDLPERIRGYGENRGVQLGPNHRLLRAQQGMERIRKHFELRVNFVESLVNRHRIELYVLDDQGQVASVFQRIHWEEHQVVETAIELLNEKIDKRRHSKVGNTSILGLLASIALAFFPKCPICWAAYLSVFGIASLDHLPYSPWLQPVLAGVMLINLGSVWLRARATGRKMAFYLASAGAVAIIVSKLLPPWEGVALWGVVLTFGGSMLSAFNTRRRRASEAKG